MTEPSLADKRATSEPKVVTSGAHAVLHDAALREHVDASWFDPAHWQGARGVERETSGRGAVLIVPHGDETWVVRHYRRGGYVARFIEDHYIWLGARAYALRFASGGYCVACTMRVARAESDRGARASARDFSTRRTSSRRTCPTRASCRRSSREHDVPAECWRRIGRMVRAVHAHGVDHPDLTAHNILLDARGDAVSRRFRQRVT